MTEEEVEHVEGVHDLGSPESSTAAAAPVYPAPPPKSLSKLKQWLGSVVKVFTVSTEPNYSLPWQMKRQKRSTSSGFVISGRRILSNAHSVVHHTSVLIRRHGFAKKYSAKVLAVGHECDLAVLTVPDEEFWVGLKPMQFGEIPHLQETIIVVGYPTGGDNISVTSGVVSRVDMTTYTHSGIKLLGIQIDAAINSGNSGGPALMDDRVVGVAFETLVGAENIGYIIPVPIIEHFLTDLERTCGSYRGFPDLGILGQSMENPHLRQCMHMATKQTGILVNYVEPLSSSNGVLRKDDVLLSVDDVSIADDGTIAFREGERISFRFLFMSKFLGDRCRATLLRNGECLEKEITLQKVEYLVPVHNFEEKLPSYFICAGLVFLPVTRQYLRHQFGKQWDKKAPVRMCDFAINGHLEYPDQQIVILSQVLAADINIGYQNISNIQVVAVNGIQIRNLHHLMSLVETNTAPYLRFDMAFDRVIILDAAAAREATSLILQQHNITSPKSVDLSSTPVKLYIPAQKPGEVAHAPERDNTKEGEGMPATASAST